VQEVINRIVLAPIAEEVLYRAVVPAGIGAVLTRIPLSISQPRILIAAQAISAIGFALSHAPGWGTPKIVGALVTGLTLGTYMALGGSLITAIGAHAAVNTLGALDPLIRSGVPLTIYELIFVYGALLAGFLVLQALLNTHSGRQPRAYGP
ncbi:MAG: CPBP family intramembrane metalloprotease, partial [Acidimicrobiia bacterium]|nr:CPBP family intramembrane metalloprotease [Acidimicrobiia bacterium]